MLNATGELRSVIGPLNGKKHGPVQDRDGKKTRQRGKNYGQDLPLRKKGNV